MAEFTTEHDLSIIDSLLGCCEWAAEWQDSRARETNTMLVMRAIANLPATASGRRVVAEARTQEVSGPCHPVLLRQRLTNVSAQLLGYLASQQSFENLNKNTRVAMSTIALK